MQMEVTQNGKIVKNFYCISSTIYSVIELLRFFFQFQVAILLWLCGCAQGYGNLLDMGVHISICPYEGTLGDWSMYGISNTGNEIWPTMRLPNGQQPLVYGDPVHFLGL